MVDPQQQEALASRYEAEIATVLSEAMRAAASRYEETDVLAMPAGFRDAVSQVLADIWGAASRQAGNAVIFEFRDEFPHLEAKADEETLFERILREFIEQYGADKVTRIAEATRDQLFRIIRRGTQDGLSLADIAKAMREAIPDLSRLRSHVIARTETHTAGGFASQRVALTARRPLKKRWVSVADSRTRDFGEGDGVIDQYSHRAMNGVTVGLKEPYMVPTIYGTREPLAFPGDPAGSAGNVVMCRCVEVYERDNDGN